VQIKNLIIPVVRSDGRGGRNKFSFENLLEIDIVKELEQSGIELSTIGRIMKALRNFEGEPIWTYIRNNREYYEQAGGYLAILSGKSKRIHAQLITDKEMVLYASKYRSVTLIGILAIIEKMEERTEIKLLPPKE
jgi:DNA-binding transcriptional MerR regulator